MRQFASAMDEVLQTDLFNILCAIFYNAKLQVSSNFFRSMISYLIIAALFVQLFELT